jgi:hypothetical protein
MNKRKRKNRIGFSVWFAFTGLIIIMIISLMFYATIFSYKSPIITDNLKVTNTDVNYWVDFAQKNPQQDTILYGYNWRINPADYNYPDNFIVVKVTGDLEMTMEGDAWVFKPKKEQVADFNISNLRIFRDSNTELGIQKFNEDFWRMDCLSKNNVWVAPIYCFDRNYLKAFREALGVDLNE